MKTRLTFFVCGVLLLDLHAAPDAGQVQPKPRTISVSGCATGYIQPDAILWTVVSIATGKNMLGAKEVSEQQVKVLLDGCAKKGIQGADVSLGMIKIQDALSGNVESAQDHPNRFTVSRTITLRQRELQIFHEMLSQLSKGNGKVSYKFYCSRVDKITRETLLRATLAAKEKASAMATVLGATLGPVLNISEYAPTNTVIKPETVIIDDSSPVYTDEAEKINISVFATFELQ